jgi:uncharacterized membrane protein
MSIMAGLLRLARFRVDGFNAFAGTPQAVLNSLAPLLAFPLVGAVLGLLGEAGLAAAVDFLATIVALVAPLVITHAFARRWGRLEAWPRFAAASNWCQWVLPVVAVVLVLLVMLLDGIGFPLRTMVMLALVGLIGYGVALHWFLARHGLGLSRARAVALVLVTDFGTGALVILPRLLAAA